MEIHLYSLTKAETAYGADAGTKLLGDVTIEPQSV
jgi:hypothetical protein